MTAHEAMVGKNGGGPSGFGETIRTINGSLECNGGNPGQVNARIEYYKQKLQLLGVSYGPKDGGC